MDKFKITIEKITEYDETITRWRNPEDPEKVNESKYDFPENVRPNLVSHQHPTGKKLEHTRKIFEQTLENLDISELVKVINQ